MRITTPPYDIHSNSTNNAIFVPMTGALNSTEVKNVRFAVWLAAAIGLKMRPAVQFSNDGITWDTAVGMNLDGIGAEYASANGWTFGNGAFHDIFAIAAEKLFCRFGALSLNVTDSVVKAAQCALQIDIEPVPAARSMTFGPRMVYCASDAVTWLAQDITGAIKSENVNSVRATMEIVGTTGNMTLKATVQEANNPNLPSDWTDVADVTGISRTTDGITWGTSFQSVTIAKRYFRIVIKTQGLMGNSTVQAASASLRLDARG